MNQNFAGIIRRIAAEQGEAILAEPQRLKAYVSDYAKNEAPAERLAFGRCIEYGAYSVLKTAPDRAAVKAALARKVHDGEGLDIALCQNALDALEAALFGAVSGGRPPAASPPPQGPACQQGPYQQPPPVYQQQIQPPQPYPQPYPQPPPAAKKGGAIKTLKILIFAALGCYITAVGCNVVAMTDLDEDMIEKDGTALVLEISSRIGLAQTLGIIMGNAADTDYLSAILQNPRILRELVNVLFDWYAPVKWPPVLSLSKEIGWLVFQNRLSKLR
jgi:hypothetical protein